MNLKTLRILKVGILCVQAVVLLIMGALVLGRLAGTVGGDAWPVMLGMCLLQLALCAVQMMATRVVTEREIVETNAMRAELERLRGMAK